MKTKTKVCILAAGVGARMGAYSDHISKAILPIKNKAVVSYIVEKFPVDTEYVIAVGHKKETVIDYLRIAHPERKFTFVTVDKYTGPGAGPGYSILKCEKHLRAPFIFTTADTIVLEDVPALDHNWLGIAPVKETESYCTIKMRNNLVYQLDNKIKTDNKFAFIGLAGIKDHAEFFGALKKDLESSRGEIQVISGFAGLIEKQLTPVGFTWFDTGSFKNYTETNKNFSGGDKKFDFSKGEEFLYFVNERVIKFFADHSIAKNRYIRATKHLKGLVPKMDAHRGSFYSYKMVPGQTVYEVLNAEVARNFLEWAQSRLWRRITLAGAKKKRFEEACQKFYRDKTLKRIEAYRAKNSTSEPRIVNGRKVPPLDQLLAKVNWDHVSEAIPVHFHGDLQFDNVLLSPSKKKNSFVLLDWRQDFGGVVDAGDLYYDLAKLYGGLTISYQLIKDGMFSYSASDKVADYKFFIKNDLVEAREELEHFIQENNFDLKKVRTLTSLIFLNMAPLHNEPFDHLLYHLGRSMLHKSLA